MSTPPSPDAEILRANTAFYTAFTRGDAQAMEALWAARAPITCFHPGATLLRGHDAVLGAWREILASPLPFEMRCHFAEVQRFGELAIVTCYEGNGDHAPHLAATNVFVHEDGAWRMSHHHAGPLSRPVAVATRSSSLN
jgi:ketosteroid isomerase-like protein